MADIFAKQTQYKATSILTADQLVLKVGNGQQDLTEFLVQNVSIQYNQPLNRLFEIGTSFVYFSPGRSVGTCQIGRVIGRKAITAILGAAGTGIWTADLCKGDAASRTITFIRKKSDPAVGFQCDSGLDLAYTLTGCVVESYGVATDANGLLVQESIAIQFAGLQLDVTE